jgi:hypothetical protein
MGSVSWSSLRSFSSLPALASSLSPSKNAHGAKLHNFGQGIWWAVVTVTTVGYGDRFPVTAFGQGVAVLLMLTGIDLIGTLTATVTRNFVQEKTDATNERLERIEAMLAQLVSADVGGSHEHAPGHRTLQSTEKSARRPERMTTGLGLEQTIPFDSISGLRPVAV